MEFCIGCIGQLSSGKSSFINAMAGEFISPVKLKRCTLEPKIYEFNKSYKSELVNRKFSIIDFPGFNDTEDKENNYFQIVENNIRTPDILLYMTSAETAFITKSELEIFIKLQNLVSKINDEGKYLELIIVINKYDDITDSEIEEIYNDLIKINSFKVKIFRISSHKMLMSQNIIQYNIPKEFKNEFNKIKKQRTLNRERGDWDHLIEYLTEINMIENKKSALIKFIMKSAKSDNMELIIKNLKELINIDPNLVNDEDLNNKFIIFLEYNDINIVKYLVKSLLEISKDYFNNIMKKLNSTIWVIIQLFLPDDIEIDKVAIFNHLDTKIYFEKNKLVLYLNPNIDLDDYDSILKMILNIRDSTPNRIYMRNIATLISMPKWKFIKIHMINPELIRGVINNDMLYYRLLNSVYTQNFIIVSSYGNKLKDKDLVGFGILKKEYYFNINNIKVD